jgi:hypothetical protein
MAGESPLEWQLLDLLRLQPYLKSHIVEIVLKYEGQKKVSIVEVDD